jgi:hypothetical protein
VCYESFTVHLSGVSNELSKTLCVLPCGTQSRTVGIYEESVLMASSVLEIFCMEESILDWCNWKRRDWSRASCFCGQQPR